MQAQAPAEVKIELFDDDHYVMIYPDPYTGLPTRYGVSRKEAIEYFANHHCARRAYRRSPSMKKEDDLRDAAYLLEEFAAKRIAPDVYELPFEMTEEEEEYLKDLKRRWLR